MHASSKIACCCGCHELVRLLLQAEQPDDVPETESKDADDAAPAISGADMLQVTPWQAVALVRACRASVLACSPSAHFQQL